MAKHDVMRDCYLRVHLGYASGSSHVVAKSVPQRLKALTGFRSVQCAVSVVIDSDRNDDCRFLENRHLLIER